MKLEDQVVSLELAKELKSLGVKQESLYWWLDFDNTACSTKDGKGFETHRFQSLYDEPMVFDMEERNHIGIHDKFSAYTVAELGEMLPVEIESKEAYRHDYFLTITKNINDWELLYLNCGAECRPGCHFTEHTEADARAKCLIYLIKNKLISI